MNDVSYEAVELYRQLGLFLDKFIKEYARDNEPFKDVFSSGFHQSRKRLQVKQVKNGGGAREAN